MENVKQMLQRENIAFHKYQLSKDSSRVFFFFDNSEISMAVEVLLRVFGIHSLSPALRTSNKLNNIIERAVDVAGNVLEEGDSFALRVKRSGKHEFSSLEVAQKVGQAILDHFPRLNLTVNLSHPKKTIYIEVREDFSYIFLDIIENYWAGLPIEYTKKILVMDVGRLNDILAGFLIMRRGCELYPIMFDNTNNEKELGVWLNNWQEVTRFIPSNHLMLKKVNLYDLLLKIKEKLKDEKYFCGMCRLIRMDIISHYLKYSQEPHVSKIRAISDGTSLNNMTFCHDMVDLESLSLNYLFSAYPIFTSIIGLDEDNITDYSVNISYFLKECDYCAFKPQNQDFDCEEIKRIYEELKFKELVKEVSAKMDQITLQFKLPE